MVFMSWSLPRLPQASKPHFTLLLGMLSVLTLFHTPLMILYFLCEEISTHTAVRSRCWMNWSCLIFLEFLWCLVWSPHSSHPLTPMHVYIHPASVAWVCLWGCNTFFLKIDSRLLSNYSLPCLRCQWNWAGWKKDNFWDQLMAECAKMWWQGTWSQRQLLHACRCDWVDVNTESWVEEMVVNNQDELTLESSETTAAPYKSLTHQWSMV